MIYYKLEKTPSGQIAPVDNFDMAIHPSNTNFLLLCPLVIEHRIDQSSPLFPISPASLYKAAGNDSDAFEIVVIVEGTMETTGDACQYRTSYKPREILWGFRFKQTHFTLENGRVNFDMATFEEFEPVNMDSYNDQRLGPRLFAPDIFLKAYNRKKRRSTGKSIDRSETPQRVNA